MDNLNFQEIFSSPTEQADGPNSDWLGSLYDWNQPGLGDTSSWYTNDTNSSLEQQGNPIANKEGFLAWLNKTGNQVQKGNYGDTQYTRVVNNKGKALGPTMSFNGNDDINRTAFALGSMFLSPFGGIAAGGAQAGIGGSLAAEYGGNAAAWNGALSGMSATAANGGNWQDTLKAGVSGGGSAFMPDVGGYLGVDNQQLKDAINGGVRGYTNAAINGGNRGAAATEGALPGLASFVGGQFMSPDNYVPTTFGRSFLNDINQQSTVNPNANMTEYVPSSSPLAYGSTSANAVKEKEDNTFGFSMPELGQFFQKLLPSTPQGWGNALEGLAGLYMGNRQRKNAQALQRSVGSNRGAYEQQLIKQLQTRDAAAGRRSDVGGRLVELQSNLAKLDAQNAPAMQQAQSMQLGGLGQMLSSALRYGGKSGWFGDSYNPNAQQAPTTSTLLPSTWTNQPPANYSLSSGQSNPYEQDGGGLNITRRRGPFGG